MNQTDDAFGSGRYRFPDGYHVGLDLVAGAKDARVVRLSWKRAAFRYPRVGIGGDGVARVIWFETPGVTTSDSSGSAGTEQLWVGEIRDDSVTAARVLLTSERAPYASRMDRDRHGRLHFLVAYRGRGGGPVLVHVVSTATGWSLDTLPSARRSDRLYPDIRVVGDTVHTLYVAPAFRTGDDTSEDINSVWYRRSNDLGRSWSPLIRVRLSGRYPVYAPRLEATERGVVTIVWRAVSRDTSGGQEISGVRSSDGGFTWSPVAVIRGVSAPSDPVGIWTDACERTHVHLIDGLLSDNTRTLFAALSGDQWSSLDTLTMPHRDIGSSLVVIDDAGTLHRLFVSVKWVPGTTAESWVFHSMHPAVVPR